MINTDIQKIAPSDWCMRLSFFRQDLLMTVKFFPEASRKPGLSVCVCEHTLMDKVLWNWSAVIITLYSAWSGQDFNQANKCSRKHSFIPFTVLICLCAKLVFMTVIKTWTSQVNSATSHQSHFLHSVFHQTWSADDS